MIPLLGFLVFVAIITIMVLISYLPVITADLKLRRLKKTRDRQIESGKEFLWHNVYILTELLGLGYSRNSGIRFETAHENNQQLAMASINALLENEVSAK